MGRRGIAKSNNCSHAKRAGTTIVLKHISRVHRPAEMAATAATAARGADPTSRVCWVRAAIPEETAAGQRRPRG